MSKGDEGLEAWRAMLLAHSAALRAIEADVQRGGSIPLTWYDVLLELRAAGPGGLRMQELSDRVVLSRTRVSRLVDEMAKQDLVQKSPDANDKRVVWASITAAGEQAFRETAPVYVRGIRQHFSSFLTEDETEVVAKALLKVAHGHQPEVRWGR
ncbi:MarR family winged helix-turn-helix transcriptional regulator [Kitasatospora azatica]|uniref:MarR family winged helix-turn-helix transcriptional regulator n=1 Tax=Kitasatospora azatica TaxID=58347 RepID=UPI000563485B|nr:MarR family transcriptional regulator [Kitasatospora azatica]